jgi:hypothetical protein
VLVWDELVEASELAQVLEEPRFDGTDRKVLAVAVS